MVAGQIEKLLALVAMPFGVVTVSSPVVAPAGTVARIKLLFTTVNAASVPLNLTDVALVNRVPEIATVVPGLLLEGENSAMVGAVGFDTCVVAVAVLLFAFVSVVAALTLETIVSVAPLGVAAFNDAKSVIVADAPDANVGKVIAAELYPAPPQTPPFVAAHDTNLAIAGRLLATFTELAALGPALLTVTVKVTTFPAETGLGVTLLLTARLASMVPVQPNCAPVKLVMLMSGIHRSSVKRLLTASATLRFLIFKPEVKEEQLGLGKLKRKTACCTPAIAGLIVCTA